MSRILLAGIILWAICFNLRLLQIGGLDPTFRDSRAELLLPLRSQLTSVLDNNLPYPQSALLSGILLGDQESFPYTLKKQLQTTSVVHMVVASGQNLTMLAGFLTGLVYLIGRRKTLLVTILAVIFYSLLTGLGVPILRAAIMAIVAYTAQLLGKEGTGWWALLLTAGAMLLYQPNWLFSISFQLSFLATFGVVVVAPILAEHLKRLPRLLRQDLAVTAAAQVLTLPVIAYDFNQLSVVGIVVNGLILWSIPFVMISGFISLGLGLVNSFLGQMSGLVPGVLLTYFIDIVRLFAGLPGASIRIGETSLILWIGYYFLLGAVLWWLKIRSCGRISSKTFEPESRSGSREQNTPRRRNRTKTE